MAMAQMQARRCSLHSATSSLRGKRMPNRSCLRATKLIPRCSYTSTSVQTKQAIKSLVVPAGELRSNIRLKYIKEGRGQALQLEYVTEGSTAWQMGLRPGQLLRGIEDPIRSEQMYDLGDRPSLRFVTDAIMMTRHIEVRIEVEDGVLLAEQAAVAEPVAPPAPAAPAAADEADDTTGRALSTMDALDALTGNPPSAPTIAEQLELQMAAMVAEGTAPEAEDDGSVWVRLVPEPPARPDDSSVFNSLVSAQTFDTAGIQPANEVQARIKRRKDYLDQVSQRSDAPLFGGLFALFVLPPAAILAIAYCSGYLDNLYSSTLSKMH